MANWLHVHRVSPIISSELFRPGAVFLLPHWLCSLPSCWSGGPADEYYWRGGGRNAQGLDTLRRSTRISGSAQDRNGDAELLKIKNCCGILVLAAAKYWSWESLAPQWAPLGSSIVSIARAIDSLESWDLWLGQSIHCAARPKRQKPLSDFSW